MTREDGRPMHVWRSRGFVQPLLLTMGGVVASWVFADAISGSCGGGDVCAYIGMAYVFYFLLAIVPGLLVTGFLVRLLSDDVWLANRSIRVAGVILWLTASILMFLSNVGYIASFADVVSGLVFSALVGGVLALVAWVLIVIGFGLGRVIKRHP